MNADSALCELLDRQAVAGLIHAYCRHFDRNHPKALALLCTADARVDYGHELPDLLIDRPAIEKGVAKGLAKPFAATSHHVSNIETAFDGPDAACSGCYFHAWAPGTSIVPPCTASADSRWICRKPGGEWAAGLCGLYDRSGARHGRRHGGRIGPMRRQEGETP